MSKTNFLENKVLDHVLRNTTYTPPATVYLALFTTDPGEAGSGTEVSGNAYVRQTVTFAAASAGSSSNSAAITYPAATPSGWGTITHIGVFDASSAGNALYTGPLTAPRVVDAGDALSFAIGALVITED